MTRTLALSAAALALAACATAPRTDTNSAPQPAAQPAQVASPPTTSTAGAFDPVGSYTFSVNTQGNVINGTMNLRKGPDGKLGGEMTSDQGSLTFTWVTVEGQRMTASGVLDNGPELVFVFDFVGDDFSGTLSAEGQNVGTISGSRRKS